ncbi:alpha/beta hydrolase [Paraburkholderia nemoris]|uniref:alpha/beta hydrolase n=1 Tax=Paraburkholderia nemoris TaxID=2793076 RepID=UPI0038B855FB
MTSSLPPTILIVPGLRDHVEDHWQTILASKLPNVRVVPPLEHNMLNCAARIEAVTQLANAWGSRLVDVGAVGHLNPASGFGEWPRAVEFVSELS